MKRLGLALGSLGLGLLSGCASLPDLQLAKQAKSEGDLATAEANFRGLAEQGYVDGEIGLADILVRSPSPERQAQAEALYRHAQERSPVAAVRLGKWLANKPQPTPAERIEAERLLRQGLAAGDRSVLLPLVQLQLLDPQRLNSGEIDGELAQWQAQGLTVIPTASWSDEASYAWCFDGLPERATVAISTVGVLKSKDSVVAFLKGTAELLARKQPTQLLIYGKLPEALDALLRGQGVTWQAFAHGQAKRVRPLD